MRKIIVMTVSFAFALSFVTADTGLPTGDFYANLREIDAVEFFNLEGNVWMINEGGPFNSIDKSALVGAQKRVIETLKQLKEAYIAYSLSTGATLFDPIEFPEEFSKGYSKFSSRFDKLANSAAGRKKLLEPVFNAR